MNYRIDSSSADGNNSIQRETALSFDSDFVSLHIIKALSKLQLGDLFELGIIATASLLENPNGNITKPMNWWSVTYWACYTQNTKSLHTQVTRVDDNYGGEVYGWWGMRTLSQIYF